MKANTVKKMMAFFAASLMLMVFFAGSLKAQISVDEITGSANANLKANAVENLIQNIGSDNDGVRKSAIYYAGYYKVEKTMNALMKQFKKESDPSVRILIALSLYKLGDEEGLEFIRTNSEKDSNAKVKRMCAAIYNEYLISSGRVAVK